jgi:hypothetical protein
MAGKMGNKIGATDLWYASLMAGEGDKYGVPILFGTLLDAAGEGCDL